jgi:hypothetical protein
VTTLVDGRIPACTDMGPAGSVAVYFLGAPTRLFEGAAR